MDAVRHDTQTGGLSPASLHKMVGERCGSCRLYMVNVW